MKITLLALSLVFAGCASMERTEFIRNRYDGYFDVKLNDDTFKVSVNANAATHRQTVEDYFYLRCAHLTMENSAQYFVVVNERSDALQTASSSSSTAVANAFLGNTTVNTNTSIDTEHSKSGIIQLFKEGKQPKGAIHAKKLARQLEQYIQPPEYIQELLADE